MIEFKDMLDRDTDESVGWARSLEPEKSEAALSHFLGVFLDPEQAGLRRLNATFILNALASTRTLHETALAQALGCLPAIVQEPDRDLRRNGLVAVSSILHSMSRSATPSRRAAYADLVDSWIDEVPDDWEKGLLTSILTAFGAAPKKRQKPVRPDVKLAVVVGGRPRPRGDFKKLIWRYIVDKGLFDPKSGAIRPDSKLKQVFKGRVSFKRSELPKLLETHLIG